MQTRVGLRVFSSIQLMPSIGQRVHVMRPAKSIVHVARKFLIELGDSRIA